MMAEAFDTNDRLASESLCKRKGIHTFTDCVDALLFFAFDKKYSSLHAEHSV